MINVKNITIRVVATITYYYISSHTKTSDKFEISNKINIVLIFPSSENAYIIFKILPPLTVFSITPPLN